MTIRLAVPGDATAVVALTSPIDATSIATPGSLRAQLERGSPPGTERLVAEVDGEIVAWAPSGLRGAGGAWLWIVVRAPFRGRGIGTALYDRIEPRLRGLGRSRLTAPVGDEAGRSFLRHRGFVPGNVMRLAVLDLRTASLPELPPQAAPFTEIDLESLCDLYIAAHGDIPSRSPRPPVTPDDFRRDVVDNAGVDRAAGAAILEDGVPVAFTLVVANREARRAAAQLTGVRHDRRGRGLALAVKTASLHYARAAGLETMLVTNDLENTAMLAVNRRLGFEPSVLVEHFERTL